MGIPHPLLLTVPPKGLRTNSLEIGELGRKCHKKIINMAVEMQGNIFNPATLT